MRIHVNQSILGWFPNKKILATSVQRLPRDFWTPVTQLQRTPVTPSFTVPCTIECQNRTRLQTQLLLPLAAVSAAIWITPGHHSPRCKNGSKSTIGSCLDVLDAPQLLLQSGSPQVTTSPDSRMAAKAQAFAWMRWTFRSCSCTWVLSPP